MQRCLWDRAKRERSYKIAAGQPDMERLERILFPFAIVIAFFGLLYLADWGVLEFRVAHGSAYRTVQINQFLATPLKGNKEEYDMMGTFGQKCSRSIFPQKGNMPCW